MSLCIGPGLYLLLSSFYHLPSLFLPCFLLLSILSFFFAFWLSSFNATWLLGGKIVGYPCCHHQSALQSRQRQQACLCRGFLRSVSCLPDYVIHWAGSKVAFKELPTVLPTVRCCNRATKWLSNRAVLDFSTCSSLLFPVFPRLLWCCLGSLAKSLQQHFIPLKDFFNVFQNSSLLFFRLCIQITPIAVWLLS